MYKLERAGKITYKRVLGKYRFVKEDLKKWVQGDFD